MGIVMYAPQTTFLVLLDTTASRRRRDLALRKDIDWSKTTDRNFRKLKCGRSGNQKQRYVQKTVLKVVYTYTFVTCKLR